LDFAFGVCFDLHIRQREDAFLPTVKRRHHEVAVVDLQAKQKLAHHTPTVEEINVWITEAKTFSQTAPE